MWVLVVWCILVGGMDEATTEYIELKLFDALFIAS